MSKSSKKRLCPAPQIEREITAAECGENRVSRYACPAGCAFNPFAPANYEMALALDDALNSKTTQRFLETARDRAAMLQQAERLMRHSSSHAVNMWFIWQQFFARDAGGRTWAERWEEAGLSGLKNDERVLMKFRMQTRVALIEVRRVMDHEQVEGVDLLTADRTPFFVRDQSFAENAVRFWVVLAWSHPLPHYWRLTDAAVEIPEMAHLEPEEIVREIVQHLGGPVDEAGIRLWLAEHFQRFEQAASAISLARRAAMFAGIDAKWGRVVYELRRPFAECRALLGGHPEVKPDDMTEAEGNEGFSDARVWIDNSEADGPALQGEVVLGRVLLGQTHWRLEAMGEARTSRLRAQFESLMGGAVQFKGQRLDDAGVDLKNKEPGYDQSLVPPRLLENPGKILMMSSRVPAPVDARKSFADVQAELLEAEDRRFLDYRVPALGDKTPREAARDPQLRSKLIRLVKQRVRDHDQRNLKSGRRDDINWLLRELGLTELLFDPPPMRPASGQANDEETEPDDFFEFGGASSSLPLPKVSSNPLSMDEVFQRVEEICETFDSATEALQAMQAGGSDFLGFAAALVNEPLASDDFDLLVPFLIQARFILVPPDCREPAMDFDEVCRALEHELSELDRISAGRDPDELIRLFHESRQPALTQQLVAQFTETMSAVARRHRPPMHIQLLLCVLMKVMIDELDRALRG